MNVVMLSLVRVKYDEFNVKSIRRLIIIIRPGVESPATR